jgi:hypothetical protein
MIDPAASRSLEFGVGDILDLDFSRLGVDNSAIAAHHRPLSG